MAEYLVDGLGAWEASIAAMDAETRARWVSSRPMYRNVDLEILSREPLDALVAALVDRVLVLHHSRERGRSVLHLDVNGSGLDRAPGRTLRRWFELLRTLRGEPRRLFRASRVVASIGLEADDASSTNVVVDAADVAALARLGAAIEVVVYRRA